MAFAPMKSLFKTVSSYILFLDSLPLFSVLSYETVSLEAPIFL